ncbi:MAG: PH domain-containing protein [Anaerolineales bacterium]|nr:PH domain-containing protein [Anaerolineales bacterium]
MNIGHFPPPKRLGMLIHGSIILVLAIISFTGFYYLPRAEVGPGFVIWLLVALLGFAPIPFFGYRAYSLFRANYILDRDSLALVWGLRVEDIPLNDIEWIRHVNDLTHPLKMPGFSLPGGILGVRRHPDLGVVEYLASESKKILLVATAKRIFAISPNNPTALAQTFARATEMGSLTPAEAKSVYPSFVIAQAWEHTAVRFLWLSGLFLNIGLFVWVSIIIPLMSRISLGFRPEPVPSTQLIILPIVSLFLFVLGWLAGLYFYRWDKQRALAFVVWASSTLTSLCFLVAVMFILRTPV